MLYVGLKVAKELELKSHKLIEQVQTSQQRKLRKIYSTNENSTLINKRYTAKEIQHRQNITIIKRVYL